jgi:hypothetical protein
VQWVALDGSVLPEQSLQVPLGKEVLDLDRDRALVLERGPLGETLISVYRFQRR